jgi:hypothetical protein
MASIHNDSNPIVHFRPRSLALDLSIGHKRGKWYLIFARVYQTADSREVVRLDRDFRIPYDQDQSCFWFDLNALTGWEKEGQSLLEYLIDLGPSQDTILKVVKPAETNLERKSKGPLVEVLVPERRLAHWCERCGEWETMNLEEEFRWKVSSTSRGFPTYVCPEVCNKSLPKCCLTSI